MGLLNKLFGGKGKNEPDPGAVNLANEFTRVVETLKNTLYEVTNYK